MGKPRILVVEDESFFQKVFCDILAEEDCYQIETAESGKAALNCLDKQPYDLILSDLNMPGMSGLDLLRHTRNLDPAPEVILVTSHSKVETAVQALKNGARDYLLKPCAPDHLKHAVRTCLEQRKLLGENNLLRNQIRLYQRGQTLATQLDVGPLMNDSLLALCQEIGPCRGCTFYSENGQSTLAGHHPELSETEAWALYHHFIESDRGNATMSRLSGPELRSLKDGPKDLRSLWSLSLEAGKDYRADFLACNPEGQDLPISMPKKNLTFLAEQIHLGFKNACSYEGARGLIYTDDLTSLHNYRYLQISLAQEIRRAERYGLEFSVVFIDLDLFKNINDTYGHLVGSALLKEVAATLKTCMREADLLFRYGGDEFTALLIETGTEGAAIVAERFREVVEAITYRMENGETCRITATVGYATYPQHATTQVELIDLADKAMYQGKRERNVSRCAVPIPVD